MERKVRPGQQRPVIAPESLSGFCAVKANRMDSGIIPEQSSEIIALLFFYGRIQTAVPLAGPDRVPERDVAAQQHPQALFIGGGHLSFAEQAGHERPEPVLRMGVILLLLKRADAGHRSEDQDAARRIDAGRKADAVHIIQLLFIGFAVPEPGGGFVLLHYHSIIDWLGPFPLPKLLLDSARFFGIINPTSE